MTGLMWALSLEYLVLSAGFALIRDWPRAIYFLAAAVINTAVLFMR